MSTANGVVYGGTVNTTGTMYALDAETGETLWTFESGGSVNTAPAIVDGRLYWGSGYGTPGLGLKANNVLYAFEVDGDGAAPVRDAGMDADVPLPDAGMSTAGTPSWSAIHKTYFGSGTVGHCVNCHIEMTNPRSGHQWLTDKGQLSGVDSHIVMRGKSKLTFFGGDMPPEGPSSLPEAEAALMEWVEAGAPNN